VRVLAKREGSFLLGVDDDDLPAAQCFAGNSNVLVAPAWRLPFEVDSLGRAHAWTAERLAREYGVEVGRTWDLGGAYYPSAGMSPELVHPMAIEVLGVTRAPRSLAWLAIDRVATVRAHLCDGHLRIVALRAAHALGLLAAGRPLEAP